jgi:hypothetical protein
MGNAAIMDCARPEDFAVKKSQMMSYMGLAIVLSPLIASRLTARMSYQLAIAIAGVQLYMDWAMLKETLPNEKRKPFGGVVNPFELYRMFTSGKDLAQGSAIMAVQNLMDVKVMADPSIVFQLNTLGWARQFSQTFTAVLGMGLLLGSKITKMSLAANGPHGHTTLTHVVSVFQNLILGLFPSDITMWLSGILGFIGDQKSHGVAHMVGLAAGQCKELFQRESERPHGIVTPNSLCKHA